MFAVRVLTLRWAVVTTPGYTSTQTNARCSVLSYIFRNVINNILLIVISNGIRTESIYR